MIASFMKIKISFEDREKIRFTSDFHLNHPREFLWGARGFSSMQEHDEWILEQLQTLPKNTILVNLGDSCLNDASGETFAALAQFEFEQHYLLNSNHMSGAKQAYQSTRDKLGLNFEDVYPISYGNITFVGDYLELYFGRKMFPVMHYPILSWNNMGRGSLMVSGHCHNNNPLTNASSDRMKVIDVGVDSNIERYGSAFITYDQLLEVGAERENSIIDHHE